ncbi:RNA-directed DNA polymerase, eukaryota, reverse transcriptase zinc-binding domain protein [Tanacetum coccineum]|uniref:RNA-directed DNA polymerase, eukaryota, reverse transcriptase zinc-binding domain protein n=1 Tax=Tanacetum coccineum TaxID=301880 RepID=A0ABQ5IN17_9ASTR
MWGKDKIQVLHLQFADDALILGDWSLSNSKNLSRILTCFHLASGLKVNFNKSKLFGFGVSNIELSIAASSLGCLASEFPCSYLGLPIGAQMSMCANWNPLVDRRSSINLKAFVEGSFGVGTRIKKKIHGLWEGKQFTLPRKSGGMFNVCELKKSPGTWSHIIKLKDDLNIIGINLKMLFKKKVGNGMTTSFWYDNWLGGPSLHETFPRLFRLETMPNCLVSDRVPTFVSPAPTTNIASANHLVHPTDTTPIITNPVIRPNSSRDSVGLSFSWAWRRAVRSQDEYWCYTVPQI